VRSTSSAPLRKDELLEDIKKYFKSISSQIIFTKHSKGIKKLVTTASPWKNIKKHGKTAIPSGDATQAFDKLQKQFKKNSVFVVEVGELECFVKGIGKHGPKWVNEVLETSDLVGDANLKNAREFVKEVIYHNKAMK
jgi:hypothetical protein